MKRYEIGDDARLAAMVAAAERGEEAVFTRHGAIVAAVMPQAKRKGGEPQRGIDWEALDRLHRSIPLSARGGGVALVREMRDMDGH